MFLCSVFFSTSGWKVIWLYCIGPKGSQCSGQQCSGIADVEEIGRITDWTHSMIKIWFTSLSWIPGRIKVCEVI